MYKYISGIYQYHTNIWSEKSIFFTNIWVGINNITQTFELRISMLYKYLSWKYEYYSNIWTGLINVINIWNLRYGDIDTVKMFQLKMMIFKEIRWIYQYSLIFQREISVFFRYVEISERKKAINDYISSGNVNIVRIVGGNSGKQFEQSDMWSGMARAKHIISNILTGKYCREKK